MRYIIPLITLFLIGCSSSGPLDEVKRVSVTEQEVRQPIYHPPYPDMITPPKFNVRVITKEIAQKQIDNDTFRPIYGFIEIDWIRLGQYFEDVKKRVKEFKGLLDYYRDLPILNPKPKDDNPDQKAPDS